MDLKIKAQQNHYINRTNVLSEKSLMITTVLSIFSLVFGVMFAYMITNHLNTAIGSLKEAADSIKAGLTIFPRLRG
jgi:hypothetical protein